MDAPALMALIAACAPQVDPGTARAVVQVESGGNPHAIGVVGGALVRQPRHAAEALATARALDAGGWDFSVGLAQINRRNFDRLGLQIGTAFDPCANLAAMQAVLVECFDRAAPRAPAPDALRQALSCYYSGDFRTGFAHGYVQRVVGAAAQRPRASRPPRPAQPPRPTRADQPQVEDPR
ncbi:MAG: lytic transglycosylase domain-containing protein [Burkholderiaceae bacterium]|jgi:type IV secretion system protein VirB1|nr:lytic transglycosylase domain-containing protein [Burkholderiaceae bacterium]